MGATGGILATEALSNGLMTAPGRAVIAALAKHGYTIDQIVTVLGQAARPTIAAGANRVISRR